MRIPLRAFLPFLILVLAASGVSYAGDAGRESHFSIGSGVRAVGLGGGFVGLVDDASAVYWNQAALAYLEHQEINLMHISLFEGTAYDAASYVYPHYKWGGIGISYMRLGTGDIIKRIDWNEFDKFTFSTSQLIVGYGRKVEAGFAVGAALKIVNQSMDRESTYGIAFDLSFVKPICDHLTTGMIFQDIIPSRLRLGQTDESTPYDIMAGIGVRNIFPIRGLRQNVNLAIEIPEERSVKLHAGFESIYREYFDFRAGFDRDNLTFGFGLYYSQFRFDYAYRIMDGIADSHRFGLSVTIGASVSEKVRREAALQDARGSYLILDDRERQFEFYKRTGDNYYQVGELDSAFVYYQRALAYRDDNGVRTKISIIEEARGLLTEQEKQAINQARLQETVIDEYYSQAEDFYNLGMLQASSRLIDKGLQLSPGHEKFLSLKEKVAEAREERIMKLIDEAAQAEKENRLADALIAYNSILDQSPDDLTAVRLKARVAHAIDLAREISNGVDFFLAGNLDASQQSFQLVLKSDPGNIVAQEYLNRIASLRSQPSEQKRLEDDEKVWKVYLQALEYYREGDYENAIKLWEQVLQSYPGNEQTLNNIRQARLRLEPKQ
jgi:tetratricopeptide (TPR) repeat protein